MLKRDISVFDKTTRKQVEQILDAHTRERAPLTRWTRFSWSVSRHHTFQTCKRAYYLTYYGARRVREANNKIISAVWWLKQVTGHRAWVGRVIHEAAARAIRAHVAGAPLHEDDLMQQATALYDDGLRASRRQTRLGKQWVFIREMVYDEPWHPAYAEVKNLMRAFLTSAAYQRLLSLPPETVLEVDEAFQTFDFVTEDDTVPVYAIPDVLYRGDNSIHIIDWKTGLPERDMADRQAHVYGVYAHTTYNILDIHAHIVTLSKPEAAYSMRPSVEVGSALIATSIAMMMDHLEDSSYQTARIRNFPMTDDLSTCKTCPFKRVCWRHD
jgi:hypothetical protein